MSLEVYGDEGDVGCEECASLENKNEDLKEEIQQLKTRVAELQMRLKLQAMCMRCGKKVGKVCECGWKET